MNQQIQSPRFGVIVAVSGELENEIVKLCSRARHAATISKRCADMVEACAAMEAGLGQVALVDELLIEHPESLVEMARRTGTTLLIVVASFGGGPSWSDLGVSHTIRSSAGPEKIVDLMVTAMSEVELPGQPVAGLSSADDALVAQTNEAEQERAGGTVTLSEGSATGQVAVLNGSFEGMEFLEKQQTPVVHSEDSQGESVVAAPTSIMAAAVYQGGPIAESSQIPAPKLLGPDPTPPSKVRESVRGWVPDWLRKVSSPDTQTATSELATAGSGGRNNGKPPKSPRQGVSLPGNSDSGETSYEEPRIKSAKVISVWGPLGSPGRSTVAINLATELAVNHSVILVDADTHGPSLAQLLGAPGDLPGIAVATRAAVQGTLSSDALNRLVLHAGPGLRVITGLPRSDRWVDVRRIGFEALLKVLKQHCDVVIIDTGFALESSGFDSSSPQRNALAHISMEQADQLIAVGSDEPVILVRLLRDLDVIDERWPGIARTVVVNQKLARAVRSKREDESDIKSLLGAASTDLHLVPAAHELLSRAVAQGLALKELDQRHPARLAFQSLATRSIVNVALVHSEA